MCAIATLSGVGVGLGTTYWSGNWYPALVSIGLLLVAIRIAVELSQETWWPTALMALAGIGVTGWVYNAYIADPILQAQIQLERLADQWERAEELARAKAASIQTEREIRARELNRLMAESDAASTSMGEVRRIRLAEIGRLSVKLELALQRAAESMLHKERFRGKIRELIYERDLQAIELLIAETEQAPRSGAVDPTTELDTASLVAAAERWLGNRDSDAPSPAESATRSASEAP
jgi:hypothetical protein